MIDLAGMKELSIGGVNLRELSVNGVKVWQKSRLPAGYTEVEWIESTGTQYIDTGIKASDYPGGITYIFTVSITSHTSVSYLMGALANSTRSGNVTISDDGRLVMACGGNNQSLYHTYFTAGELLNVRFEDVTATDITAMKCYTNDVEWDKIAFDLGVSSAMPDANIYFLKCNGSSRVGASCKTHGRFMMIDSSNGDVLRDFKTCINQSGTAGLFDLVSNKFFPNAGTGAFTAGPAV